MSICSSRDAATNALSSFLRGSSLRIAKAGVLITTYSMISFAGQRSEIAKKIIDTITKREWGFMLLDEVSTIMCKTSCSVYALNHQT